MIRFGLRLTVAGGREAVTRLAIIAAAVALGVGLLVATLAGINAVSAQNARYAWLNSDTPAARVTTPSADPLWWLLSRDYFAGRTIGRIDVAATGPDAPVPPGMARLPGPGEYYASPALHDLIAAAPADELGDRYPGREIGTIGPAALPAPNILLVVVGHSPDQLAHVPGAQRITGIATVAPSHCDGCVTGVRPAGMDLILSVVTAALLFPVLIFIGTATRLSATRRELRFAAMRLIGATPRQISVISAVESTVAAVIGTVVGFGLFFAFRGPLAAVPFTGMPFFPGDLSPNLVDVLLVAIGVPVGAAVAAQVALRRVRISPLGVTRRVTPRPPRAYRLIPLLAGIVELAYLIGHRPDSTNGQVIGFLSGILVMMVGLLVAGPWLTMVGARFLARRSRRPATLIAARRLADNPQAGFRAISGLVLALFVTTVAIGVITTIVANRGPHRDPVSASTLEKSFFSNTSDPTIAAPAGLTSVPGVQSVTVLRRDPDRDGLPALVSCADLARTPAFGHCPAGATVAQVWDDFTGPDAPTTPDTVWPAAPVSAEQLQQLPVLSVVVGTDGSTAAIERARTIMELAFPGGDLPPSTFADFAADSTQLLNGWQQLASVVILASLPIAGCSLAASVAGGLSDRKRPFSLLRLAGVPLRVLRRVVALESAVPLLAAAAVAIGAGFLAAQLFLRAQMQYSLRPPGPAYYAIVAAGLLLSLGIIAGTLPLLERITGPETARNE
jgi:FtsX-like permease family